MIIYKLPLHKACIVSYLNISASFRDKYTSMSDGRINFLSYPTRNIVKLVDRFYTIHRLWFMHLPYKVPIVDVNVAQK